MVECISFFRDPGIPVALRCEIRLLLQIGTIADLDMRTNENDKSSIAHRLSDRLLRAIPFSNSRP